LTNQEDASKHERMIDNIDQDVEITLVDDTQGRMNEEDMFGVNDLVGDEVVVDVSASEKVEQSVKVVEKEVSIADPVTTSGEVVTTVDIEVTTTATTPQISKDELTLAQTLKEIKAAKPKAITTAATTVTATGTRPKAKGIVMQETSKRPTPTLIDASQKSSQAKDKGKEEERLARLKEEETNIALVAEWDNIQAMMDADSFVPMDTELVKSSDKAVEGSEKAEEGSSKRATDKLEQGYAKREDLEVPWSIVKARCKKTKPIDDMDNMLFQTLKTMFKHHVEDNI
nr:hypothetical protein [Tanacetum cinerariifolium]